MKKVISIFMVMLIMISVASCGRGKNAVGDVSDMVSDAASDVASDIRPGNDTNNESDTASGSDTSGGTDREGSAESVLSAIWKEYADDERFAAAGGDMNNAVNDAPGAFDLNNVEDLNTTLGLPEDQAANVTDAASLMHMMNANTFTGACYRLKDGTDVKKFADALSKNVMARQWICGTPETFLVLNVNDEYVVSAFGADDLIQTFKNNATKAIGNISVISETPVVENAA